MTTTILVTLFLLFGAGGVFIRKARQSKPLTMDGPEWKIKMATSRWESER
jgi:hypothetical protein